MIVVGRNGRRKSLPTKKEILGRMDHIKSGLTPDETALLRALGEDSLSGSSVVMDSMLNHIYHTTPVSMEQFIEDPYYLGESCTTIYPAIKKDLIDLFKRPYRESICTGSLGVGKSFVASIAICRIIYELSCLISPQKTFGLSIGSEIVIPLISKNLTLAREIMKTAVDTKVKESPYFMTLFTPKFATDYTLFPNNIRVIVGSYGSDRITGGNCFSSVLDECNFPPRRRAQQISQGFGQKLRAEHFDIVEKVYQSLVRRIKSRFQRAGGGFPGMVILASSAATVESFTERKIRKSADDPDVFCRDHTAWTAKPKSEFCGEVFWVLCSTSSMNSRILTDDEVELVSDEYLEANDAFLMDIPVEYKEDFESNMEEALRDIAGFSTQAISLFVQRQSAVYECIDESRKHPFSCLEYTSGAKGHWDWDTLCIQTERKLPGGFVEKAYRPRRNPEAFRWCHIDVGISGDSCGFTIAHIERWVDVVRRDSDGNKHVDAAPYYVIDVMLRINPPPGEQIYLPDLRSMIYQFMEHGYKFIGFSSDTYMCLSGDTLVLTDHGIIKMSEIKTGHLVETRNGVCTIDNSWCTGERDTLILELTDGQKIEGTPSHRIETLKGWIGRNKIKEDLFYPFSDRGKAGNVENVWEWKQLSYIKVGDVIRNIDWESSVDSTYIEMKGPQRMNPGGRGRFSSVKLPAIMNEKLAEFIGLIWGDGDITKDTIRISSHSSEVDDLIAFCTGLFGVVPNIHRQDTFGIVSISSVRLIRWLADNGIIKEHPLVTPETILKSPRSVNAAFIRGLFSADGNVGKVDGCVSLSTNSKLLAEQVAISLRMLFNIQSKIVVMNKKYKGDFSRGGPQYIVNIRGPRIDFYNKIGFTYATKMNLLEKHKNIKGRVLYNKVRSISNGRCNVYDISVDGDHSYIANGIVSHNCVEMHQQIKRRGITPHIISTDTSTTPYDELKSAFYENRIEIYDYEPFTYEFLHLEYDRIAGKIDHPTAGSKDQADSVAGAIFGLKESSKRMPLEGGTYGKDNVVPYEDSWVSGGLVPMDRVDMDAVKEARNSKANDFLPIIFGD